jgi:hypothetical protein
MTGSHMGVREQGKAMACAIEKANEDFPLAMPTRCG